MTDTPPKKRSAPADAIPDGSAPLPSAVEAERCVLSCMLQSPDFACPAVQAMKPGDFSLESHGLLFDLIQRQFQSGGLVDMVTVTQILYDRGQIETVGGPVAISDIYTAATNPAHVPHYAALVIQKAMHRALVRIGWALSNGIMVQPDGALEHAAAAVEAIIAATTGVSKRATIIHIKAATSEALDAFETAYNARGHLPAGLATGFTDLDRTLWGLKPGDNCFIAGRPSMGKTALAVNILFNMATARGHYAEFYKSKDDFLRHENSRQGKKKVVLVCLESPPIKMAARCLSGMSGVSMQRIRDGMMAKGDWAGLATAAKTIDSAEFYIWDAPGIAVEDLEMELKAFRARHTDLAVVCVDHCGLLRARGVDAKAPDYARISYISNRLMILWRQLDVVGLPLWQLSREVEKRADKKPRLSDLRDSGNLEQDATHVIGCYREHYYDKDAPEDDALLCVLKNRDGGTCSDGIPVNWNGELTLFTSRTTALFSNNEDKRQ